MTRGWGVPTALALGLLALSCPSPKVAALVAMAVVSMAYAYNRSEVRALDVPITSRFETIHALLNDIDADPQISTSGKCDIRIQMERAVTAYIRAMTQMDAPLRRQHVSQYELYRERAFATAGELDVATPAAGVHHTDILGRLTSAFDEMDAVLTRSKRAPRRGPAGHTV